MTGVPPRTVYVALDDEGHVNTRLTGFKGNHVALLAVVTDEGHISVLNLRGIPMSETRDLLYMIADGYRNENLKRIDGAVNEDGETDASD
jgi:hypothetical protein